MREHAVVDEWDEDIPVLARLAIFAIAILATIVLALLAIVASPIIVPWYFLSGRRKG